MLCQYVRVTFPTKENREFTVVNSERNQSKQGLGIMVVVALALETPSLAQGLVLTSARASKSVKLTVPHGVDEAGPLGHPVCGNPRRAPRVLQTNGPLTRPR